LNPGESSSSTYASTLILGGDTEHPYVDQEVQKITLVEKDVTVEVTYGTVTGCYHFHTDLYMGEDPDLSKPSQLPGDFWYKPGLGPVKAGGDETYELVSTDWSLALILTEGH